MDANCSLHSQGAALASPPAGGSGRFLQAAVRAVGVATFGDHILGSLTTGLCIGEKGIVCCPIKGERQGGKEELGEFREGWG